MTMIKSFRAALSGIALAFREERSFRIQTGAALVVVGLMIWLPLKPWEYIILALCIGLVLVLELLNTVFERFVDMVKPRLHSYVEVVKDLMAGAVLVMSAAAAVVGLIIFVPHLWSLVVQ